MERSFRITSRAEVQIIEVFSWYENIQFGLGSTFEDEFTSKLNQILQNPFQFQVRYKSYRLAHLRTFPYSIYYLVTKEEVLVYAFLHQYRSTQSEKF